MIVVAIADVVALVPDAGLSPSEKPKAEPVVAAAAVEAGARAAAEVVLTAPRGLSIKARPPPAAVVVAAAVMLGAEVGAALKVKPVPGTVAIVGAAAVGMGDAKRDGPDTGAAWVAAGGAGVDEGLIPKANPPPP